MTRDDWYRVSCEIGLGRLAKTLQRLLGTAGRDQGTLFPILNFLHPKLLPDCERGSKTSRWPFRYKASPNGILNLGLAMLSLPLICLAETATNIADAAPSAQSVWLQTAPLISPRTGAGVIAFKDVIYAIGGVDGRHFLAGSEYSTIQDDGTLAAWRAGSDLNEERGFFGVAVHNGFIYAVGGGNGPSGHHLLRSVERAAILADGRLGPWQREIQTLNCPRRCAKTVASDNYLYAIGGFGGALFDSVERARFNADGSLGRWEIVKDKLTLPRYIHAEAEVNGRLYVLGGHAQQGGMGEVAAEYTALRKGGELSAWQATVAMKHGRYGLAAASHGDYLYALGGMSGATFYNAIEKNHVAADGALGVWSDIAPLPAPLADFGIIVYRDWIYVVGGTGPAGYFNNVFYSRIDKSGDMVPPLTGAGQVATALAPTNRVELPNRGTVTQSLEGGTYIYLEVDTGAGKEWLAAAHADITVGDRIRYSDGIWMRDFFSKYLQRHFDAIRFVGNLEKAAAP
jgi:hypothetical protein